MGQPDVSNVIKDPENDILYDVKAYRKLSMDEITRAVQHYVNMRGKPKRGSRITIISVLR